MGKIRLNPKRSHQNKRSFFRHFVEIKNTINPIMHFSALFDRISDGKDLNMSVLIIYLDKTKIKNAKKIKKNGYE